MDNKVLEKDLVEGIAERTNLPKTQVRRVLEALKEDIIFAVKDRKKVNLTGLGFFESRFRKARKCVNPQTKEMIQTPDMYVPKFRAAVNFREEVK